MPTTSESTDRAALRERLERSSAFRVFAASAADSETIARAERRLGIRFSPSYRWFLETFGGGYYHGNDINGLAPPAHCDPPLDDLTEFVGDVVARHELNRQNPSWNPHYLEVLNLDGDEIYALDTSTPGEHTVLLWEPGQARWRPAFKNFLELLDALA